MTPDMFSCGTRLALSVLLVSLAAYDLRNKRIPNAVMRPAVIAGWLVLVARLALSQVSWEQVGLATLTSAICLALWWIRAFGGGDTKLLIALVALFPDARFVYAMMIAVLLGSLLALIVWDGRAGLRRLAALFVTASRGAWPDRAEVAAAYQKRGRPITFAFSLGAVLYIWLVWPGWI
ncbi:MAG: prepilin peptidase [Anaerolineales bacterium]|nr:prepilin peptidase [Anaerolineales bacterium]